MSLTSRSWVKCLYGQQGFCGFGTSITSKMYSNQKIIPVPFCHKIKLSISCFNHAQYSWLSNERMVVNDVTSGTSQCFMFSFCFLDDCIASPALVVCFLSKKLLTTIETTLTWTSRMWQFLIWRHDPFRNLHSICTDSQSTSLGVAEAGTLKLDLRALKCQNPFFFLEYLFTHYRATTTIKTLLAV